MLNQLNIIGRVTIEPTLRQVNTRNGEISVCNTSLAVSVFSQGSERTTYFRVAFWGNLAERAIKVLKVGTLTFVTGTVRVSQYVDKNNDPKASLEVNASNFTILFTRNLNVANKNSEQNTFKDRNFRNDYVNSFKTSSTLNGNEKIDLEKVENKGAKDTLKFSFKDELKGIINESINSTQVAPSGTNKYHFDNTNDNEEKDSSDNIDIGDDDYE